MSLGRVSAVCMSHEIGGTPVRRPSADNEFFIFKKIDVSRIQQIAASVAATSIFRRDELCETKIKRGLV